MAESEAGLAARGGAIICCGLRVVPPITIASWSQPAVRRAFEIVRLVRVCRQLPFLVLIFILVVTPLFPLPPNIIHQLARLLACPLARLPACPLTLAFAAIDLGIAMSQSQ